MHLLSTAFGTVTLNRQPQRRRETLRAWDAADELLLAHVAEAVSDVGATELSLSTKLTKQNILVINDQFGALAGSLRAGHVTGWSDSWLSHKATIENHKTNAAAKFIALPSIENPQPTQDCFQIILLKIPKTLALLEQQLHQIRPLLLQNPKAIFAAAGMAKHIHRSTLTLFETIIGPTTTSLASKKARLVFAKPDSDLKPPSDKTTTRWTDPQLGLTFDNLANVFSREKFDIGARAMIEQFDQLPDAKRIIDLGCGNGVLGIVAQQQLPDAEVVFCDESYMALASAEKNYQVAHPERSARFIAGHALSELPNDERADLILCNPPFHQQHSVGDHIAQAMFRDAHKHLAANGELWVVGNRHLGYGQSLKRLFRQSRCIGSNQKFSIFAATK